MRFSLARQIRLLTAPKKDSTLAPAAAPAPKDPRQAQIIYLFKRELAKPAPNAAILARLVDDLAVTGEYQRGGTPTNDFKVENLAVLLVEAFVKNPFDLSRVLYRAIQGWKGTFMQVDPAYKKNDSTFRQLLQMVYSQKDAPEGRLAMVYAALIRSQMSDKPAKGTTETRFEQVLKERLKGKDGNDAASDGGSSSDYSGDEAERRPRRLGFAGSGGSLSTLVDDEEAAPLVTETDSPGDGDDDTASP